MYRRFKTTIYQICKSLGLFSLARRLTAGELRILCYHGISIEDEHLYMPGLFMRPDTIRARLAILTQNRYPVLPLNEALERLWAGNLPRCAVVITYDDGFYGNYRYGLELYGEYPLPTTIYVTTYYVQHQSPIFRHVVQYMFWKTNCSKLLLDELPGCDDGVLDLADSERARRAMWALILKAESDYGEAERIELSCRLGFRLGVDYDELVRTRRLSLMTPEEVRTLAKTGIDIQLHTHRHQFLPDKDNVTREIEDNRSILEPLTEKPCNHLCYPSGVFAQQQWPWLEGLGIVSATTCEPGLNNDQTERFGLRRFLDMESITNLEFEAEVSGFAELLRRLFMRNVRTSVSPLEHGR